METMDFSNIALSKAELSALRAMRRAATKVTDKNRAAINGLVRYDFAKVISDMARITPAGIAYLAYDKRRKTEQRLTYIIAIWGAVTGTVALLIELWQYFLQ